MDSYGPESLNFASVPLIQQALNELTADRTADPAGFERTVKGFAEAVVQPPFHGWGHDQDFGSFALSGTMGTRHTWMLSRLLDHFGVSLDNDVRGKQVLDVGTWSGAVTLVLAKLGAHVTAIDTGALYIDALRYLADSFGLDVVARTESVYEVAPGPFDTVFCLGVIYHLQDPIAGLQSCADALKPGGLLCVESYALDSQLPLAQYYGPSTGRPNPGYNPSPLTLSYWLNDIGLTDVHVGNGLTPLSVTSDQDPMGGCRTFGVARKPV